MKTKGSRNVDRITEVMILRIKAIYPDWSAQKIYDELKRTPALIKNSRDTNIPKVRKIQQILSDNDNKEKIESIIDSGLESPWNLALMSEYPVSPEALPYIFLVQNWADTAIDKLGNPLRPLSVRMAIWISRIYPTVRIPTKKKYFNSLAPSISHYLYKWAEAYAVREQICELVGIENDTSGLDKGLRQSGEPETYGKTTLIFYRHDDSFEIDTIDDNLLKQIETIKKDGEK